MMNNYFESSVRLLALLALIPCFITESSASERKVSMNENWKFYRGCIANADKHLSKTLNGEYSTCLMTGAWILCPYKEKV